jgi:hypothetical protein
MMDCFDLLFKDIYKNAVVLLNKYNTKFFYDKRVFNELVQTFDNEKIE